MALVSLGATAQIKVSGTVTDTTGEPPTGASVQTGTTGVTTDIDGKYTVTADAKGT